MYESFEAIPLTQVFTDLRDITRATLSTIGEVYLTPTALALLKGAAYRRSRWRSRMPMASGTEWTPMRPA